MWIARDKDDSLKLWSSKPNRVAPPTNIPSEPILTIWDNGGFSIPLSKNTWKELTWEDEPVEVSLIENKELELIKRQSEAWVDSFGYENEH